MLLFVGRFHEIDRLFLDADLRGSAKHSCVTFDEGLRLAQKLNLAYVETSALLHTSRKICQEKAETHRRTYGSEEVTFHIYELGLCVKFSTVWNQLCTAPG